LKVFGEKRNWKGFSLESVFSGKRFLQKAFSLESVNQQEQQRLKSSLRVPAQLN